MAGNAFDMPHDDDVYVNHGEGYGDSTAYYPKKPADQVEEDRKTDATIAASYPVIEDVAQWFQEQIALSNDIHNVQVASLTINGVKYSRSVSVEAQVLAYQLLQELLTAKFHEFEEFARKLEDDAAD